MNSPYLSCLKTYWAEIWILSWLPPNILLAPILVLLRPSLILFFQYVSMCNVIFNPERAPKAGPATCWPAPPSIHRGLEWPQCLNRLIVLCLLVCLSANFLHFIHFSFHFIHSRIRCIAFHSFHRTHKTSLRIKKTIPESMPCIVAHSTRRYIGTAVGPLHPALHRNGA